MDFRTPNTNLGAFAIETTTPQYHRDVAFERPASGDPDWEQFGSSSYRQLPFASPRRNRELCDIDREPKHRSVAPHHRKWKQRAARRTARHAARVLASHHLPSDARRAVSFDMEQRGCRGAGLRSRRYPAARTVDGGPSRDARWCRIDGVRGEFAFRNAVAPTGSASHRTRAALRGSARRRAHRDASKTCGLEFKNEFAAILEAEAAVKRLGIFRAAQSNRSAALAARPRDGAFG